MDLFIWANQFANTRAFGYTERTTMIPVLDYINHAIKDNSNVKIVVKGKQPKAIHQIDNENENDDDESDNDSDIE